VLLEPCDAIVPPVAKIVTLGSEALMGVCTSWRVKRWRGACIGYVSRSMGDAEAKAKAGSKVVMESFICVESQGTKSG
jgi:hypothetical protein